MRRVTLQPAASPLPWCVAENLTAARSFAIAACLARDKFCDVKPILSESFSSHLGDEMRLIRFVVLISFNVAHRLQRR